MVYQALYRKWRPKTFDDVVGQEHITTTLKNQVAAEKLSHAYLFCGSRGTGKTSCSKILAKAVNCPNPKGGNPCGVCPICIGIDNDSILDVTEIDAASNSGVDNIRDLREEANFTPVTTRYRVYIIDETHMLSVGAFNALLKIMEEPPPHVLFILATTEIHKVPATILSRCQRFDFQRIPSLIIKERLLYVAKEEGVNLATDAALLIARLSDGGLRDALSLLDLCLSRGTDISYELVQKAAGLTDTSYLLEMGKGVAEENFTKALNILTNLWNQSIDPLQFTRQLLTMYRNLLVIKSTTKPDELIEGTLDEVEALTALAQDYSLERLFYSLSSLSETLSRIMASGERKIQLEMGLLRLCNPQVGGSLEALIARIEKLEKSGVPVAVPAVASMPVTLTAPVVEPKPVEAPIKTQAETGIEAETEATIETVTKTQEDSSPPSETSPLQDSGKVKVIPFAPWPQVLEILASKNKALYGTLVESTAFVSGDLLLVDAGSELFSQMIRSDEYAREFLREAAEQLTGVSYRLGPYKAEDYSVEQEENNILSSLIDSAQELGLNLDIKE